MPLAAGSRLGHYEIAELIGKGGMGEVYRARDSKLNRFVALKVLPGALANNPERMARFQREAQLLAQLNHPNIAAIYGLEDSGNHWAIVMELVEGETLQGPLPVPEAVRLAKQIADAVEYAHDKTVIHRDLKPANIKVTPEGQVKVLDFGLAKALDEAGSAHIEGDPMNSMSPTLTMGATQAGVILGTAAYMAPEQAKGKRADRKADVWAFGVVLYEMLTGKRVFAGETMAETLASVMKEPLTFDALPKETPAALRKLVMRCLDRDLRRRVQSMAEARIILEDVLAGRTDEIAEEVKIVAAPAKPSWIPWAIAGSATLAALLALWAPWKSPSPVPEVVRLEVDPPEQTTFNNAQILSPDGRHMAFTATADDGLALWVRSLDSLEARLLAKPNSNPVPFWSADSKFILFQDVGKLKKVDLAGGPPITITDAPVSFGGGTWSKDGRIVLGDRSGVLVEVPSGGGAPIILTKLDEKRQEYSHALPWFLPDGKHFLYLRRSNNTEFSGVYVGALDTPPEKQEPKPLLVSDLSALYAATGTGSGYLFYTRDATLLAQPFDPSALAFKGDPIPLAKGVRATAYGMGRFTVSDSGSFGYSTGGDAGGAIRNRLTWLDRKGMTVGTVGERGPYNTLALSPDGSRVAAELQNATATDLWLMETGAGGKSDRFTFSPSREANPVWSSDGAQIVFSGGGPFQLFVKPTNLGADEVELFKSPEPKFATDWSRDGKTLLFTGVGASNDLWSLSMDGAKRKAEVFLKTDAAEQLGKLSPDGRWLAYMSNATGKFEVYVRPFPVSADRTGQWMVSNNGGQDPHWRRDGKELFYVRPGSPAAVMAVDVSPGEVFKAAAPKELFPLTFAPPGTRNGIGYTWDVMPDGQKFLFSVPDVRGAARSSRRWSGSSTGRRG